MKVDIILPTKYEEDCIGEMVRRISLFDKDYRIIVVDDSDNVLTQRAALLASKEYQVDLEYIGGAGNESASIKEAIEYSHGDFLVILDADCSQSPEIIPDMIGSLVAGADLCIGSRYCERGSVGSSNAFSLLGNKFARSILRLHTNELTSRYLAGRKDLLLKASKWDGRGENSIDVVNYCEKRKLNIQEIPFTHSDRIGGNSKTNISKYLKIYLKKVFKLKLDSYRLFSKEYIFRALNNDWTGDKRNKRSFTGDIINIIQFPVCIMGMVFCKIPILSNIFEIISRIWGKSRIGFLLRGIYYKSKLGFMGVDVFIDQGVTILNPQSVFIEDGCLIDQDTQLICGEGKIRIGKNVHIGSNCYLNGKPFIKIEDFACIDHSSLIFGSTNEYEKNGYRFSMSCVAPNDMQCVTKIGASIGKMSFLGPNSVLVCANIGDNVIVGANSFVKKDIGDNLVVGGSPAKIISERINNG